MEAEMAATHGYPETQGRSGLGKYRSVDVASDSDVGDVEVNPIFGVLQLPELEDQPIGRCGALSDLRFPRVP